MQQVEILYVEDSTVDAMVLQLLAKKSGHPNFLVNSTAEEALLTAEQHIPKLILIDFHLPGMNGVELAKALKSNAVTRHIPLVMVSTNNASEVIRAAKAEGVDEFLVKPISLAQMTVYFRHYLGEPNS
jgi:CheY-like chemotaxis protein